MADQNNNIQNQQTQDLRGIKDKNKIRGTEEDHDLFAKKLDNINELLNTYIDPTNPNGVGIEGVEGSELSENDDARKRETEKRAAAGLVQQQSIVETPAQRIRNQELSNRMREQGARTTGQTNDAIKAGDDV